MKKKSVALLMAAVLTIGVVAGSTVAWLMAKSETVTNTFTIGDINVTLDESKLGADNELIESVRVQGNTYQLIPGTTYPKDPVITIEGSENNVDCWLFVKFDEGNAASYLTYTSALTKSDSGWTKLDATVSGEDDDVWYREVTASKDNQQWELLAPESVTVKDTIVKGTATGTDISMPSNSQILEWKAYVVQKDNLDVTAAWELVDPTN